MRTFSAEPQVWERQWKLFLSTKDGFCTNNRSDKTLQMYKISTKANKQEYDIVFFWICKMEAKSGKAKLKSDTINVLNMG